MLRALLGRAVFRLRVPVTYKCNWYSTVFVISQSKRVYISDGEYKEGGAAVGVLIV